MLEEKFRNQKEFFDTTIEYFHKDKLTDRDKILWAKEYILSTVKELCEFLDELPWKLHRIDSRKIDKEKVLEELIDVQKFVWNLFHLFEITSEDIERMYDLKSKIVVERWKTFLEEKNNDCN